MTKRKNTKRALITSALALIVTISMLAGSTYAWFTDSVTSAGNIIKSGTLNVEMQWADGKEDPASANWEDASQGAIFNYDLWEPGYTEVRHVRIANVGTLALKYQLDIVANGAVSELADVIDVYYSDPAKQIANRTDDMGTKLGTLTEVLAGMSTTASGVLLADDGEDEVTVTLALKMQESAGNEYQNKSIGTDFSVQLLATQYTYEEDSFDNQYDYAAGTEFVGGKGTEEAPYLINEASQLLSISDYNEYTYFKVADGVDQLDMTGIGRIILNGSFDGNGVELVNLSTSLFKDVGDINNAQDIKISNFTATVHTTDGHALVRNILNPGNTTFENIALHGYIEGQYNMGSFYNYGTANGSKEGADYTVSFVNATSDATLVCTTGNSIGGMLGHGYEGENYTLSVNMDDASDYTGQMYTTGTATCYKVMAMCSHATYKLNGVETSRYEGKYPSTKLVKVDPTEGTDGYYVAPVTDVDHYVVYLNAQLTAYDSNGNKIANKSGMTGNLGNKTISTGFDGKIFDSITSAQIVNGLDHNYSYEMNNGALTVYTGRSDNYASGWITLQVNQYDANGTLLATGITTVHTFPEP